LTSSANKKTSESLMESCGLEGCTLLKSKDVSWNVENGSEEAPYRALLKNLSKVWTVSEGIRGSIEKD